MTWIPTHRAIAELRSAGIDNPVTLAIWAEQGHVRARANVAECDGEADTLEFIPDDFWMWVRIRGEMYWDAGVFAATVEYPADENHRVDSRRWKFSDVSFHLGELRKKIRKLADGQTEEQSKQRATAQAVKIWLDGYHDPGAPEDALIAAAEEQFAGKSIPRQLIRDAIKEQNRPRGRPPKKILNRPFEGLTRPINSPN